MLADDGGLVWTALGGTLGRVDVYRAADGSLLTRHETAGDVESVEQVGGLIYFGGHDIGPTELEHVGVIDPAAPAILDAAAFDEPTTGGDGTWALHSTGRDLWVGGNVSGPYFGFARYPAVPRRPPGRARPRSSPPWRYLDTGGGARRAGRVGFDDAAWPTGPAELGFGDTGEGTVLRRGPGHATTSAAPSRSPMCPPTDLRLDLLADDGAAVYVNGTEVARTNLPTGTSDRHHPGDGRACRATPRTPSSPSPCRPRSWSRAPTPSPSRSTRTPRPAATSASTPGSAPCARPRSPPADAPAGGRPAGATWRYRDQGRTRRPTWNQPGFDDGTWPRARPSSAGRRAARPPSWPRAPAPAGSGGPSRSPTPRR